MDRRPSSLSSSFSYAFTYDVFLSFRGSDTRHGFTGNLYKALSDKGIRTFIDDETLQRGDEITPSLMEAIEKSRIAIPVFSVKYASSSFCLDELVNIMKRKDILVLPIFYKVDPSHVGDQEGSYGEEFAKHEKEFKANKEKLKEWKMALHQAANLAGFHFNDGKEYEYEFIGKIVNLVSSKINRDRLHVADYPVGLESRIQEVKKLLDVQSDKGANMVGIYGPGGMGKTTLALAIYNLITDHFDSSCFLRDVREKSKKCGIEHLQSILLQKIFGEKEMNLESFNQGIPILEHRLGQKKVLLILDDVDEKKLLQEIFGRLDRFGPNITIIITTRNKCVLEYHNIEKTFEVKKLDDKDALQLLRWKAFKSEEVVPSHEKVLMRAVTCAVGLPLALEVIGSNLYNQSMEVWESTLKDYEEIPEREIVNRLRISYDALQEKEKSVFLDIACCFKEYPLKEVNEMLCAHYGGDMKRHIKALVDKSLIKIEGDEVTLHDLIEDMGKDIVRQESPKKPGKRSRLWFYEDILQILKHDEGSNKIEIILLKFPFSKEKEVKWDGDAFKKMKNLKTLIIQNGNFSQGPSHLPNSLRVLEWNKYPSEDLPSGFCPNKLVICELWNSRVSSLGLTSFLLKKEFVCLKDLNFNFCGFLTQIPDISCLERLERLSFRLCKKLRRIHNSVGSLKKLKSLAAEGCANLGSFPPLEMTSLEHLDLSHCKRLESFPEISVKMGKMRQMYLEETPIKKLPRSFRNLPEFETLVMIPFNSDWNCRVSSTETKSIITMPELTEIAVEGIGGWVMPKENEVEQKVCTSNVQSTELTNCTSTRDFFLVVATCPWFANVKELILYEYGRDFIIIPEYMENLEKLGLFGCMNLQEIRGIQPNLKHCQAMLCEDLTDSCRRMLLKQELHKTGNTDYTVPYTPVPEWFDHRSRGPSVSFWFRNNLPELVLCLAVPYQDSLSEEEESWLGFYLFINGNECSDASFEALGFEIIATRLFNLNKFTLKRNLNEVLSENEWNFAEIKCLDTLSKTRVRNVVIESGIHVLKQESGMKDIRFPDPEDPGPEDPDPEELSSDDEANEDSRSLSHFPLLPASERLSLDDVKNKVRRLWYQGR